MNFFNEQIKVILKNDPSITSKLEALTHPSIKAMFYYKIANILYRHRMHTLARLISNHAKKVTGIEIHPGAKLCNDLFIDHGSGVVIGETSVVGHNVVIFHGVTLGGRGKSRGKRHPTIKDNVLIGTGAKILGNIVIGNNVLVGANAVVLKSVEDNNTVVGVPGHMV